MSQGTYIQKASIIFNKRLRAAEESTPDSEDGWTPAAALEALKTHPEAFWAYHVLADTTDDLAEQIAILSRGVAMGCATVGFVPVETWDLNHTVVSRNFVRLRLRLIELYWEQGNYQASLREAEAALQELGSWTTDAVFPLAAIYAATGDLDRIQQLVDERIAGYDNIESLHATALACLMAANRWRSGDREKMALAATQQALACNGLVLDLLLCDGPIAKPTGDYSQGSIDQALLVAGTFRKAWRSVPRGLGFLKLASRQS